MSYAPDDVSFLVKEITEVDIPLNFTFFDLRS
jgi:hypothetical protein